MSEIIKSISAPERKKFTAQIGHEQTLALIYAVSPSIVLEGFTVAGVQDANVLIQVRRQPDGNLLTLITADFIDLPEGWQPVQPTPEPVYPVDPAPTSEIDQAPETATEQEAPAP